MIRITTKTILLIIRGLFSVRNFWYKQKTARQDSVISSSQKNDNYVYNYSLFLLSVTSFVILGSHYKIFLSVSSSKNKAMFVNVNYFQYNYYYLNHLTMFLRINLLPYCVHLVAK